MRTFKLLIVLSIVSAFTSMLISQDKKGDISLYKGPIIDMHLHAENNSTLPPEELGLCIPLSNLVPHFDPKQEFGEAWTAALKNPSCKNPIWSSTSFEGYTSKIQSQLEKYKVRPVVTGSTPILEEWKQKFSNTIIPSLEFQLERDSIPVDSLRRLFENNGFQVLGEISNQYAGIPPNDPRMDAYYALAEEMEIPVAIHMGTGAPGSPYLFSPKYVAAYSNPLLLEEVLKKYPKLRISIMHYGEPFIDELITMMYHYPQIYVDLGGIQWAYPSDYFYQYHLKKMMAAGFGKRIMFGSDTFLWPELLGKSIDIINEADFLTMEQKADIFYNNAARFLRMD